MLGIYADYLRQVLSHQGSAVSSGMAQLLADWILQDKEQMFPRSFEFATASTATMTSSVQVRELFGPLPEMLEKRIRSADATIKTSSAVLGRAGGPGVRQAQQAGTQSYGAAQKPATLEKAVEARAHSQVAEGEVVDLDSPSTEPSRGHPSDLNKSPRENQAGHVTSTGSGKGAEKTAWDDDDDEIIESDLI